MSFYEIIRVRMKRKRDSFMKKQHKNLRFILKNLHSPRKLLTFVAMCGIIGGVSLFFGGENTSAFDLNSFRAGNIMSDAVMSDHNSMTQAEIQRFLESKVTCDPWGQKWSELGGGTRAQFAASHGVSLPLSCMPDFTENGKLASQIIWETAQEFRINPQVIIVTLQKEQALITDEWPFPVQWRTAMGFGCPDSTPGVCNDRWWGFTNQVRSGARLFREVLDGGWTNYPVGNNFVLFNPDPGCGGSIVNIENLATSSLYRYTPYQPNAAALAAGLGSAPCGAYGNRNFFYFFNVWFGSTRREVMPNFSYSLLNVDGWSTTRTMAGTTGQGKRTSALKMTGAVEYGVYDQNGWRPFSNYGMVSGSVDSDSSIEMIAIKPTDNSYDIYYRTHNSGIGWLGWARNGEKAGTLNQNSAIEAIEVQVVKRGTQFSGYTGGGDALRASGSEVSAPVAQLSYSAHVQNIGWQRSVGENMVAGTVGRGWRIEDMRLSLVGLDGSINYRAHIQGSGWVNIASDGESFNNVGRGLRMEAIMVALSGEVTEQYDIYYRTHIQGYGWLNWAKNGEVSGSAGQGRQIEAIEFRLVEKGDNAPVSTHHPQSFMGDSSSIKTSDLSYRAHVQNIGWQNWVRSGIMGTSGRGLRVESLNFSLKTLFGEAAIFCTAHIQSIGWDTEVADKCGTSGLGLRMEAIRLSLNDTLSDKYDIYYRAHVQNIGWQSWVKNGEEAGTTGKGLRVEAIEVDIRSK